MSLDELRKEVDRVDGELVRLLGERAELTRRIGQEKRQGGLPIQDTSREDEVMGRVKAASHPPLDADALDAIYRVVIRECTRIQETSSGGE